MRLARPLLFAVALITLLTGAARADTVNPHGRAMDTVNPHGR